MLEELQVANLALSSRSEVDFAKGFCCITGETGAGKSLLVDALSLVLGARADPSFIKSGEDKAEIAAYFSVAADSPARQILEREDLLGDDEGTLLMRRVISLEGKSRAYVNGHSCTLATLKALSRHLVSIHGQHASVRLIDPEEQLSLLDHVGGLFSEAQKVASAFNEYSGARLKLTSLAEEQKAGASAYKTLRYELEALRALNPAEGSYEALEAEYDQAVHAEQVQEMISAALESLSAEESNLIDELNARIAGLEKILPFAKEAAPVVESLVSASALLGECRDALQALAVTDNTRDSEDLSQLLSRYHELSRRFAVEPKLLYTKVSALEEKLGRFLSLKDEIAKVTLEVKALKEAYEAAEAVLHEKRAAAALEMGNKVASLIRTLEMPDGRFEVRVRFDESARPRRTGRDEVSFWFSANLGEPLRTLGEAASGGELSRLALAIETINSRSNLTPTIVFDEVDAGISGRTASSVGQLLHTIAQNSQVLCVTHLPQVAAFADRHFLVSKSTEDGRVRSEIKILERDGRIRELARMMGGNVVTDNTLISAKELLEKSDGAV